MRFSAYAWARDGILQALSKIEKLRLVPPEIAGPPKGPAGLRVSAMRQGVTGLNRRPETEVVPACETAKVLPAIVSVPVRAGPVLAAIEKATVPLPLPLAPDVMVSQDALLVAVHAQPLPVVMLTELEPLDALTLKLVCDRE